MGKFHPITSHEGTEGKETYRSTLSLTSALDRVGATLWPLIRQQRPVTHSIGGGRAPGPVWTDAETPSTTGIRSPDHPGRRDSLHRLRYASTQ
jgi:hypothetical protein